MRICAESENEEPVCHEKLHLNTCLRPMPAGIKLEPLPFEGGAGAYTCKTNDGRFDLNQD